MIQPIGIDMVGNQSAMQKSISNIGNIALLHNHNCDRESEDTRNRSVHFLCIFCSCLRCFKHMLAIADNVTRIQVDTPSPPHSVESIAAAMNAVAVIKVICAMNLLSHVGEYLVALNDFVEMKSFFVNQSIPL